MSLIRAFAAFFAIWAGTTAYAADLSGSVVIEEPIVTSDPCADTGVLGRISERFAWAEAHTWRRGFIMASIANGRQGEHRFYEPGLIKRHYCVADSVMTDGTARPVYYAIEVGVGFASIGNSVDFCVPGLDEWHVHDEACRTVR